MWRWLVGVVSVAKRLVVGGLFQPIQYTPPRMGSASAKLLMRFRALSGMLKRHTFPTGGGLHLPYANPAIVTLFEPLEEGFLVAFGPERGAGGDAHQAIASLDPWQRFWIPEEHAWWIADDAISRLARSVPSLAEALAAWHQRPIHIADFASTSERWKTWTRLRRGFMPPQVRAACARLGLGQDVTPPQVRAARRRLARDFHPDAGGAHEAMARINADVDTVLDWLKQQG